MATQAFREWLLKHEESIASGAFDYHALRGEFEQVIGRAAVAAGTPEVSRETVAETDAALHDAGDPATGEG